MKIYNTLTRSKEELTPITPGKIRLYWCGATVYGLIHIGNARPAVTFDTLRRYLTYKGYDVTVVSNFTDVDDKIINRASAEGVSAAQIAEKYIGEYWADTDGLNVLRPTHSPRVTQVMDDIVDMIATLIDKGAAYEIDGTVFFDAGNHEGYGKLSRKNMKELMAGARVEADTRKKSPQDFVLWKPAKPDEPKWASPWGEGRPGWHIECSVMAKRFLGDTFDIHGGGEDLIFPHHENEIAQSEAANGVTFCNCFMHCGMINVDSAKMSKSKGNFRTARELAEEFGYDVLRFFILSSHYRSPLNFAEELIDAAKNGLSRIRRCYAALADAAGQGEFNGEEKAVITKADAIVAEFDDALADDLNTANAVSAMFEFVTLANTNVKKGVPAAALLKRLAAMADILGIRLEDGGAGDDGDVFVIEGLLKERAEAKAAKDWKKADEIRDKLAAMKISVRDTPDGVKWSRDE